MVISFINISTKVIQNGQHRGEYSGGASFPVFEGLQILTTSTEHPTPIKTASGESRSDRIRKKSTSPRCRMIRCKSDPP
jgi:hypothetical protein